MKNGLIVFLPCLMLANASADNPLDLPPEVWLTSAAGLSAVVAGGVFLGNQKTSHVAGQSASGLLMGAALGGILGGGLAGAGCLLSADDYGCEIPLGLVFGASALGLITGNNFGVKLHSKWTGVTGNANASLAGVWLSTLTGALLAAALWPEHETERYQRRNMLVPIAIVFPNLGSVMGFNLRVGGSLQRDPGKGAANLGLSLARNF